MTAIDAGPSEFDLKKARKQCAFQDCDQIAAEIIAEEMYQILPKRPEILKNET